MKVPKVFSFFPFLKTIGEHLPPLPPPPSSINDSVFTILSDTDFIYLETLLMLGKIFL